MRAVVRAVVRWRDAVSGCASSSSSSSSSASCSASSSSSSGSSARRRRRLRARPDARHGASLAGILRVRSSQTFEVSACRLVGHPLFVTNGCMHACTASQLLAHRASLWGKQSSSNHVLGLAASFLSPPVLTQLCGDTPAVGSNSSLPVLHTATKGLSMACQSGEHPATSPTTGQTQECCLRRSSGLEHIPLFSHSSHCC